MSQYILNNDLRDEIYRLLEQAKSHDPQYKQLGADEHKYVLNPPLSPNSLHAIETKYEITLPEDFFWFLTEVGNGGAGPNRGIFPLHPGGTTAADEWLFASYENARLEPPPLPLSDEVRSSLMDDINSQFPWNNKGMVKLTISAETEDYSTESMLVVTGPDRGRVIEIDSQCYVSEFPIVNSSFLDWYMGWLHESAAGYDIGWFGWYKRLGSPEQIMADYAQGGDEDRRERLFSLQKTVKQDKYLPEQGPGLSPEIQQQVISIYRNDPSQDCRYAALQVICRCKIPCRIDAEFLPSPIPNDYWHSFTSGATDTIRHFIQQARTQGSLSTFDDAPREALETLADALNLLIKLVDSSPSCVKMIQDYYGSTITLLIELAEDFGKDFHESEYLDSITYLLVRLGRIDDVLTYATGSYTKHALGIIASSGPVAEEYWSRFFSCIDDGIHYFQTAKLTSGMPALLSLVGIMHTLAKTTPASIAELRKRYAGFLNSLEEICTGKDQLTTTFFTYQILPSLTRIQTLFNEMPTTRQQIGDPRGNDGSVPRS